MSSLRSRSGRLTLVQTVVFAAVPAFLLARCGIWPSFPDELLSPDGGTTPSDVRGDVGDATSDVRTDGTGGEGGLVDVVGGDASDGNAVDVPPASWNGFRSCPAPGAGPFNLEPAFAPDAGVFNPGNTARDIAFDGAGRMIVAARDPGTNGTLYSVTPEGRETVLYSNRSSLISGVRFFADGDILIAGTYDSTPMAASGNLVPGVTVVNRMGMAQGRFQFMTGYPWAAAVNSNGSLVVTDFQNNGLAFFANRMVMGAMPTSITMNTGLNNPRSLAFSADYRKLYVASEGSGTVTEFDVDATGLPTTMGSRVYAMGLNFPRGMAFDECGNLYVADSAGANGRIARILARTGVVETLINFPVPMGAAGSDARSIAFGAGAGFSDTTIYIANARERLFQKVDVGIRGQALPRPNM